jgi:hypothetical protein
LHSTIRSLEERLTDATPGEISCQLPKSFFSEQAACSTGWPSVVWVVTVTGCISEEVIVAHPEASARTMIKAGIFNTE